MERSTSVAPQPSNKLFDRRRSFRDIQGVISKMNPELLKSVIGSVELKSNAGKFSENGDPLALNPSTLKHHESVFPPALGGNTCGLGSFTTETTPLTIFYNGTVAVFDVPRPRAENILKLAVSSHNGNLPIARRKSLQRFLEKRKESTRSTRKRLEESSKAARSEEEVAAARKWSWSAGGYGLDEHHEKKEEEANEEKKEAKGGKEKAPPEKEAPPPPLLICN